MTRVAAIAMLVLTIPFASAAQENDKAGDDAPTQAPQTQGPMTVERVHNGWAIAPDFRVTKFDGTTGRLAGAYGGYVFDDTLLIGAGGYWLTNGSHSRDLQYGGAVVEWLQGADRTIGYSVRGLVGFGTSRLSGTIDVLQRPFDRADRDRERVTASTVPLQVVFRDHFFVFEPQADALIRLTRLMRLDVGVGYRVTDAPDGDDSRLRGVSGSVAIQIGGVSASRR
jgi:hypothetical protein